MKDKKVIVWQIGYLIVRFQNVSNKVAIEPTGVQFWPEIVLMNSNRVYDFRPNCTPLSLITIINVIDLFTMVS